MKKHFAIDISGIHSQLTKNQKGIYQLAINFVRLCQNKGAVLIHENVSTLWISKHNNYSMKQNIQIKVYYIQGTRDILPDVAQGKSFHSGLQLQVMPDPNLQSQISDFVYCSSG